MKKNVKRLIAGAVVLLVAAGIVVRIAGGNKKEAEYETRPTVAVENPKTGDITLYTDLTGTIEPISKAVVQPKIGGELLEVNFQAGDQVQAGQVLCKIDSDALTALQLQMQSASVAADNAARELARIQRCMHLVMFHSSSTIRHSPQQPAPSWLMSLQRTSMTCR